MGKSAEAHERGAELTVTVTGGDGLQGLAVQDLVTILGNLLDNALDAAAAAPPPKVELGIESGPEGTTFTVVDSGNGIDPGIMDDVWQYGFSTKAAGIGQAGQPGAPSRGVAWPWSGKRCSGLAVRCPSANPRPPRPSAFGAVPRAPGAPRAGTTKEPK